MSLVPCVLEAIYNITFNFNKKKKKKKEKIKRKKEEIKKERKREGWMRRKAVPGESRLDV